MKRVLLIILVFIGIACQFSTQSIADEGKAKEQVKPASDITMKLNNALLKELPFSDKEEFEDAAKGFIAPLENEGVVNDKNGKPIWDMSKYSFIKDDKPAPSTVNPSLWRQSQLVMKGGLFKVTERLYQVRNADLSNMTIIEGDTGIIVVDPLISTETAKAALDLYYKHRPKKAVVAVIHSHSHVDHYGGVRGVVDEKDVKAGKIKIIAPDGFLQAAVAENIMAGTAMTRRASYMYGSLIPPSPTGNVGAGLGMTTSNGTITIIPPTDLITKTGQKMKIDGLDFEFLLAPGSEAPSEMHWYISQLKAVTAAENCTHTLHNTYSLRGTKIRDPLKWSKYLNQTLDMWGDKTEVMYGMHHWPVWGKETVRELVEKERDAYRYINDQTLRLANHGETLLEIAEELDLPESLKTQWSLRSYYGTLSHNIKATYVYYLGWFDGNPANLYALPPVQAGKKYVEFMGGADNLLKNARAAYDKGEYRWVAEVVNHLVFADPDNMEAKSLQADALEQLGYQSEAGPWRNFFLTGARELRNGVNVSRSSDPTASVDTINNITLEMFFDFIGMRINNNKAEGKKLDLVFNITDKKEGYTVGLMNSALHSQKGITDKKVDATVTLTRDELNKIIMSKTGLEDGINSGNIKIDGDKAKVAELFSLLDTFDVWFNIVTP